jgi:hypothetical protein
MSYVVYGVVALLVLGVAMTVSLRAATRLAARGLGVSGFRWFDAAPAPAPLARRAGMRAFGALGPFLVCVTLHFVARLVAGDEIPSLKVTIPNGPAKDAGMEHGDRIVSIDKKPVATWEELLQEVRERRGPRVIEVARGRSTAFFTVTPRENGSLGVMATPERVSVGAGPAAIGAVLAPFTYFRRLVRASGEPRGELSGPVAIVKGRTSDRDGAALFTVALLATMAWPFVAAVHAFDAVMLAVFRRSRAAAASGSPARTIRIARRRQSLVVALAAVAATAVVKLIADAVDPGPLVLLPLLVVPAALAHYPLVWQLSNELEGASAARLKLALSALVPCAGLVVGALLVRKASRELRTRST